MMLQILARVVLKFVNSNTMIAGDLFTQTAIS